MVNRVSDSVVNVPHITSLKTADVELIRPIPTTNNNPQSNESARQELLPAEKAKKMTASMNRFMESTNTNLRFQFHEELQEYYVTIVDSKTDEVVKEIPSKKLMDIYAAMRDFLGVLVDHKI
ncbi:flagellar protein FlaG [Psychrobacillus sp. OK028]|uniref:flagellar protein FlaG n=1 Tax=Psychrobacillus sp. OK028 TaxID=1884359 RepID=UPI00088ECC97|nr:flagellar protein FlaG [Psychrobacillus sp. OK028]SDM43370.1 flagellar protein FlaG [Psychrobacillus sp. OK028]